MKTKEKEIVDSVANAVIDMQGCKFLLATIVDDKKRRVNLHRECSEDDLFLFIKGLLSQFEVLKPLTLHWISDQLKKDLGDPNFLNGPKVF